MLACPRITPGANKAIKALIASVLSFMIIVLHEKGVNLGFARKGEVQKSKLRVVDLGRANTTTKQADCKTNVTAYFVDTQPARTLLASVEATSATSAITRAGKPVSSGKRTRDSGASALRGAPLKLPYARIQTARINSSLNSVIRSGEENFKL